MGNWLFGSSGKNSDIEQPKFFEILPEPYAIKDISPTLTIYTNAASEYCFLIDSGYSASEAVEVLLTKACLADCDRFVVVTHGFRSNQSTAWLHDCKDNLLTSDSAHPKQVVAILGWGGGADIPLLQYAQAASNGLEVGRWLGEILTELRAKMPNLLIYGVGHSLGAHLMGNAGKVSKGALNRITGLDPAGVGFQDGNHDKRLNQYDAPLVDVIHTDGQDVPYFGTLVPLGTIDFYPNYGWNQPTKDRSRNVKPDIEVDKRHRKLVQPSQYGGYISESHGRAIDYYIWSIKNPKSFRSNLRLDGVPDVEKAVHRIVATGTGGTAEIVVEMGYYCDQTLEKFIELEHQKGKTCTTGTSGGGGGGGGGVPTTTTKPQLDPYSKYDRYSGCYYVHTNATPPWA